MSWAISSRENPQITYDKMTSAMEHSYKDSYQALHDQYLVGLGGGTEDEPDFKDVDDTSWTDGLAAAILKICHHAGSRKCNLLLEKLQKWKARCHLLTKELSKNVDLRSCRSRFTHSKLKREGLKKSDITARHGLSLEHFYGEPIHTFCEHLHTSKMDGLIITSTTSHIIFHLIN